MIDRREIITICRQIGNMMDAGVDILRITQVLRAQTTDARLLRFFDQFDHDLRMGSSIAEGMVRGSDLFSPFMITLVRQAEQRSDLETVSKHVAGAFLKIADFVQQDEEGKNAAEAAANVAAASVAAVPFGINAISETAESWPLTLRAIENFTDRLQIIALRALTLLAGLLLSLGAVWASVEAEWIEKRWQNVVLSCVSALFIGGAGIWVRRQIEKEKQLAERCSFCSHQSSEEFPLRPVPGFPGAAICAQCATLLAHRAEKSETPTPTPTEPAPQNGKAMAAARIASPTVVLTPVPAARPGRVGAGTGEATYE